MSTKERLESKGWSLMSRITLRQPDGSVYLSRIRLLQTPWLRVFIHRMDVPDPGIDLHDHPWAFFRLILKGGYCECIEDARVASQRALHEHAQSDRLRLAHRPAGTYVDREIGHMSVVRHNQAHTVVRLLHDQSWSLVIAWGRKREWGFFMPNGWVSYLDYDFKVRRELGEEGVLPQSRVGYRKASRR